MFEQVSAERSFISKVIDRLTGNFRKRDLVVKEFKKRTHSLKSLMYHTDRYMVRTVERQYKSMAIDKETCILMMTIFITQVSHELSAYEGWLYNNMNDLSRTYVERQVSRFYDQINDLRARILIIKTYGRLEEVKTKSTPVPTVVSIHDRVSSHDLGNDEKA